jgi:hypothetical protein
MDVTTSAQTSVYATKSSPARFLDFRVAELYCERRSIGNRVLQRWDLAISGFLEAILTATLKVATDEAGRLTNRFSPVQYP